MWVGGWVGGWGGGGGGGGGCVYGRGGGELESVLFIETL